MSILPFSCPILVPVGSALDPGFEESLRELERRGHTGNSKPRFGDCLFHLAKPGSPAE